MSAKFIHFSGPQHAVALAARASADNALAVLRKGGLPIPPAADASLFSALVMVQLAAVRVAAQDTANTRAELARLTVEQCLAAAQPEAFERSPN